MNHQAGDNNTDVVAQPALRLPQPVRQTGRPARQRQRLFTKKPVVFERLKQHEADVWRLQQLVTTEAARAAVRSQQRCGVDNLLTNMDVCDYRRKVSIWGAAAVLYRGSMGQTCGQYQHCFADRRGWTV